MFVSLLVLFLFSFGFVIVVRWLLLLICPDSGAISLIDEMWLIFLEMTDPGSMTEDNASPGYIKFAGILAGMVGVVIFSMLIAFITTQMDTMLDELKKGHSKVLEAGQTLILGWNDQVLDIIRELVIANESESDASVVVLAEKDKVEMDDEIATSLPDTKTTRVITRRGNTSSPTGLLRISADKAKSAIILATASEGDSEEDKRTSDAKVLKTILALISCQGGENRISIVADLLYESNRELLRTFESEMITAIDSWDILGKILVQTSRTSGLATVYDEILSFAGCELYFYEDGWGGQPFYELPYHFQDGVPIGIRKKNRELVIRPERDTIVEAEDEVLIIAEDDSTIQYSKEMIAKPEDLPFTLRRLEKKVERELILGWHSSLASVITREYTEYLVEGSTVDIMIPNPSQAIIDMVVELQGKHTSLTINPIDLDPMSMADLKKIDPFSYDNIIILSQSERGGSSERVDSETLFILLLLRKILRDSDIQDRKTKLITQVMNSENQELITQTNVDDFLISNKIVTMIFAQISEEAGVRKVYSSIFQEAGSEIYLKPASLYFESFPVRVRFVDMIGIASKREEICLGLRLNKHASNPKKNFGVMLNPKKDEVFKLEAEDTLVVLAEDEL